MKKIKKLIILLLILSMFGFGKIGVDAAIKYENEMINCAYAYKYCDGVLIKKFDVKLGRYNGAVAVFYSSSGDGMNIYKIEHIYFAYPRYNDDIFIYKNEKIYDLRTAYKLGIVNIKQVAKIQLEYNEYTYSQSYEINK